MKKSLKSVPDTFTVTAVGLPSRVRLSLVLPTYQEAHNISSVIDQVTECLDGVFGLTYELLVIDDDSPDGTAEVALKKTLSQPHLRVIRRTGERGLASAVVRGWQAAAGEILGVMDADLQHSPRVLPGLLAAIDQGADLAIASRHVCGGGVSHWSASRRLLSRAAQFAGWIALPEVVRRVSDPMSGYFLVRRNAITDAPLHPLGYKILIEIMARARLQRIVEVGYVFHERLGGASKVSSRIYVQYLWQLILLRVDLLRARVTFLPVRLARGRDICSRY